MAARLKWNLSGGRRLLLRTLSATQLGEISALDGTGTLPAVDVEPAAGADGVTWSENSTAVPAVIVVGDFPSEHGLHLDHSHAPRWFGPATITAVQDGPSDDPDTWDEARVPTDDDIVHIPTTLTILPGGVRQLKFVTLAVNTNGKLVCDFSGVSDPTTDRMRFLVADVPIDTEADYTQMGNGVVVAGGEFVVKGKAKTTRAALLNEVTAGQTSITLTEAPTGWYPGDVVVIPDTRQADTEFFNEASTWHYLNSNFSVMTVASVAGAVVTFTASIPYDHKGAEDEDGTMIFMPKVINLTRNVVFESENPAGTRGHMLFHGRPVTDRQYYEIKNMGRSKLDPWDNFSGTTAGTNQQGRYGHHDHHNLGPENLGAEEPQGTMIGCSLHNDFDNGVEPPRWSFTLHGIHYHLYRHCVSFNVTGSGFTTEDGDETNNEIDQCSHIGVWSKGTGENSRGADLRDVAHAGTGFWFGGVENIVTDNYSASAPKGYGIIPYMQRLPNAVKLPAYKGADPYSGDPADYTVVHGQFRPMNTFSGNEAGGKMITGMDIWKLGTSDGSATDNPSQGLSTVEDFKVWHVAHSGYYNYMVRNLTFTGCYFLNDFVRLRNRQGGALGIFQSDYTMGIFKLVDSTIKGFGGGWFFNLIVEGCECIDCTFCNYRDIEFKPVWGAGGHAHTLPHRQVEIVNPTFVDPDCDVFSDYGPQAGIWVNGDIHAYSANLRGEDVILLTDYLGAGNDYRLYADGYQEGGSILLETLVGGNGTQLINGADGPDMTNSDQFAIDGGCYGDKITPGGTTTLSRILADVEVL